MEISALIKQDLKVSCAHFLAKFGELNPSETKYIMEHLTKRDGTCHNCSSASISGEGVCKKCNALNIDLRFRTSFNGEFCVYLEYYLCSCFGNLPDESVNAFWCDGIDPIPFYVSELSQVNIRKNRQINTRAWTGVSGQEVYHLQIDLGDKAVECFLKGLALESCLPSLRSKPETWIQVIPEKKWMSIQLE